MTRPADSAVPLTMAVIAYRLEACICEAAEVAFAQKCEAFEIILSGQDISPTQFFARKVKQHVAAVRAYELERLRGLLPIRSQARQRARHSYSDVLMRDLGEPLPISLS